MSVRRPGLVVAVALAAMLGLAGCTPAGTTHGSGRTQTSGSTGGSGASGPAKGGPTTGSGPAGGVATGVTIAATTPPGTPAPTRPPESTSGKPRQPTPVTPTPVTPAGLVTGPGVDDSSITLGLLVDASLDRGFTQGFELWRTSVNAAGGECGRTIRAVVAGADGIPRALPEAYLATARTTLGYVTLTQGIDTDSLARYAGGDGVPALTTAGLSSQLSSTGPLVVGPTDDIMAINAFSYLQHAKLIGSGSVGVLSDGSAAAMDSLVGLRWAAASAKVDLDVRSPSAATTSWGTAGAVFSLASPADTVALLAALPSTATVMTTITGYDPALVAANPAAAAAAADHRLLVVMATPALGSDHPAAVAIAGAFAASGATDPGPRLLEGYAAGATWGRLLDAACAASNLTRSGVLDAMSTIGPAPIDSMLGPTDPGLVINAHLPATRLSAITAADPEAPTGLTPVTWLEAAQDIGDYQPHA